jgi:hypothetical protein
MLEKIVHYLILFIPKDLLASPSLRHFRTFPILGIHLVDSLFQHYGIYFFEKWGRWWSAFSARPDSIFIYFSFLNLGTGGELFLPCLIRHGGDVDDRVDML